MKMILLCLATLLTMGCNNFPDDNGIDTPLQSKTFHATFGEDLSRVYLDSELKLHWNASDEISLFCSSTNEKYQFKGEDGDISGDFSTAEQSATSATFSHNYAVYPYISNTAMQSEGTISYTLPATQEYAYNSMGSGANTMVAVSKDADSNDLQFRNLCGYLCLQLYGKDVMLEKIVVAGNNDEKLAGRATISAAYDALPTVKLAANATKSITLNCNGVTLGDSTTPTNFYVTLPPTTFEKGFTVTVTDSEGKVCTIVKDEAVTIERNTIQPMKAKGVVTEKVTIDGLTAPASISMPAQTIEVQTISIGCSSENVTVSASEPWFGVVGGSATVAKGSTKSVSLWLEPNFSTKKRSGEITVTGATSGITVTIPLSQPAYFTSITEGFPAKLETQTFISTSWASKGICSPVDSPAVLSAVSVNGKKLTFNVNSGAELSGTEKGDYFIYAVPVENMPAGEQIDFMCTIVGTESNSPKYWIFEYWDNGRWNAIDSTLRTAEEDPTIRYSFYNKYFSSAHQTVYTQSFSLSEPVVNDCVKVRLRTLSSGSGITKFSSGGRYMSLYLIRYKNAPAITDTKKILFVGNSFTYYYGTAFMLKEIARTEGHQIEAIISTKGSQEFTEHLQLERTNEAIARGGFDYAFLQDASNNTAIYADKRSPHILQGCEEIYQRTKSYSPSCNIIFERAWGCPKDNYRGYGSYDRLDYLTKTGAEMIKEEMAAKGMYVTISPIGLGFREGRSQGLSLLHTDNHHQNRTGAYLKSCINYLLLYGKRFSSNVSNCGVDAATAAIVRQIAERVIFEGIEEVYDFETPEVANTANCYVIDKAGTYSFRADIMGNGNIPAGSAIASAKLNGKGAKVLWATYNTTTAPQSNDELITNVKLEDNTISFSTGANGYKEGNAVIALYDDAECKGNILWSWHIWFCDDLKEQTYNNKTWLDRNLGAISATAGDAQTNGLLYQFGRKDPFRGAAAISSNVYIETTGSWPATTSTIPSSPEAYVIANPMQHINNSGDTKDWFAEAKANQNPYLWNSQGKTMYDPCPAGYKVPDKLSWNIDMVSDNPLFTTDNFVYNKSTRCRVYTEGDLVVVYPIAGCISAAGELTNVGSKGYYRTNAQYGTNITANHMELTTSSVDTSKGVYRVSCNSVRCVKE